MIVNKYSVLSLFVESVGLVLAAGLAAAASWAALRIRRGQGEIEASRAERRMHLATLVAVVSLTVLVLGWPLLYAMLNSFVPEIPGAMCIYGVTKIMPAMNAVVQASKPAMVFLLGGWVLLDALRRRSGTPPRRMRGMLSLVIVAGLLATAHGAELYYVANMSSLNTVSCCCCGGGQIAKLEPPTYYLPWTLPGPAREAILNTLFFGGVPLVALWLLVRSRRQAPRSGKSALAENTLLLSAVAGLAAGAVWEFSEVLAPLLMRLPLHHCLYCLLFNGLDPDAPLIVGNMLIGIFAAGWVAVLGLAFRAECSSSTAWRWQRRLCLIGATTLLASVLMVAIHLAVYHG
jgi:hypothetical protein